MHSEDKFMNNEEEINQDLISKINLAKQNFELNLNSKFNNDNLNESTFNQSLNQIKKGLDDNDNQRYNTLRSDLNSDYKSANDKME
jgi:hypothetical protein